MLPANHINHKQRTFEELAPAVAPLATSAIYQRLAAHSHVSSSVSESVATLRNLEAYPLIRFVTKTSTSDVHRLTNAVDLQNF